MEAVPKPMNRIGEIDLFEVPVDELKAMHDAGECVRECYRVLKRTNDSIVSEYVKRYATFHADKHDLTTPIIDRKTNSQYSFHTDPAEERPHETGHFHTFVQTRRNPPVGTATPSDRSFHAADAAEDNLCHIIAIAMDRTGFPTRLFAPNKWVTGGAWHKAADVCHQMPHFTIDHAEPSYPVNVWITNMLVLFRPQIRDLLTARDNLIAARCRQRPEEDILEDRGMAVTVDQTIDVMRQLNAVRETLRIRTGSRKRMAPVLDTAHVANADAGPAPPAPAAPAAPAPAAAPAAQTREQAVEAALQAQIQTLHNAVLSAKTTAHALEDQVETARRQAWQREKEHERAIAELRESHEAELARHLTDAKARFQAEFQKKFAAARAEWQADTTAQLESAQRDMQELVSAARASAVTELRAQWQDESKKLLAEIIEEREVEEAKRLTAAKDDWEIARRDSLAERDHVWQVAFEHRVDEALAGWQEEEHERFAKAKAEWRAERKFRESRWRTIRLWSRRIAAVLTVAAVIGGGVALYPIVKPVAIEMWDDIVVANWTAIKTKISASVFAPSEPTETGNSDPGKPATDQSKPAGPQSYIRPEAANLRSEPSRAANVVGILNQGTQVSRLNRRGSWVRIRVAGAPGQVGWIHASVLANQRAR